MSLRMLGIALIFIWFFGGGIAHFVFTDAFLHAMPPALPFHREAVYAVGVFEILGAIGVLLPNWRAAAGLGLFLLTIAVTPVNVHLWQNPQLLPRVPDFVLSLRLLLQLLLLALIWWATQTGRR